MLLHALCSMRRSFVPHRRISYSRLLSSFFLCSPFIILQRRCCARCSLSLSELRFTDNPFLWYFDLDCMRLSHGLRWFHFNALPARSTRRHTLSSPSSFGHLCRSLCLRVPHGRPPPLSLSPDINGFVSSTPLSHTAWTIATHCQLLSDTDVFVSPHLCRCSPQPSFPALSSLFAAHNCRSPFISARLPLWCLSHCMDVSLSVSSGSFVDNRHPTHACHDLYLRRPSTATVNRDWPFPLITIGSLARPQATSRRPKTSCYTQSGVRRATPGKPFSLPTLLPFLVALHCSYTFLSSLFSVGDCRGRKSKTTRHPLGRRREGERFDASSEDVNPHTDGQMHSGNGFWFVGIGRIEEDCLISRLHFSCV